MKRFDFNDCMEKGLLRNVPPSRTKARTSIRTATKWLEEARKGLDSGAFNSSVLSSYLAMFHSARAVLFFDGMREKSHYCIARYLEEKYVRKNLLERKWVDLLDHYRELRYSDQYSMSFFATENEAENALKTAEEFIQRMEKLLGSDEGKERS